MRSSFFALVLLAMVLLPSLDPAIAEAQQAGTTTSAPATTSPPPPARTEHARSETSGSTATITRGGDPTTAPVRERAPAEAEEELPVNEEDDGRKADFIWLEVEGGVSYVDLIAFQQDNFSAPDGTTVDGFEEVTGVGPMVGVGLGFRIFFLALGARATLASYPGFEIGTVGGEVQFRLPTPIIEPWIRVGAGYAWMGSANYEDARESDTTVYGWMLNGAVGLDFFITWWLTLGIGGGLDVLNMTRQPINSLECPPNEFCPTEDGDAIGAQGRGFVQVGLHF
ncbi:hypothetical protein [Sandaracinus amylolyticus]|uniref:Outer membrane protein beta-barrel domain-containing protein n=1 Tax=Sandaracinus amylolyticus TaxID=927083 RepID=A0A0F6W2R2_9BACT|nr:hypothetical protein [Sandaracinus amylolyticus]AKF05783.1 hypothetical protein DB32_002932 [Sandaracinus amylolyticus]